MMIIDDAVVLVDSRGEALKDSGQILTSPKLEAHQKGLKHLAVSVFLFNSGGQLLLQQRALTKYHSPGRWSNTCCTHPQVGEAPIIAARRRLREEMGLQADLKEVFTFSYQAAVGQDLIENEFDHIFLGQSAVEPHPDPQEVCAWKWIDPSELDRDIQLQKSKYTAWFLILWPELKKYLKLR